MWRAGSLAPSQAVVLQLRRSRSGSGGSSSGRDSGSGGTSRPRRHVEAPAWLAAPSGPSHASGEGGARWRQGREDRSPDPPLTSRWPGAKKPPPPRAPSGLTFRPLLVPAAGTIFVDSAWSAACSCDHVDLRGGPQPVKASVSTWNGGSLLVNLPPASPEWCLFLGLSLSALYKGQGQRSAGSSRGGGQPQVAAGRADARRDGRKAAALLAGKQSSWAPGPLSLRAPVMRWWP